MTAQLSFRNPQGKLITVPLDESGQGVLIGREAETCRVSIYDPMLSSVHAVVRQEGTAWIVEDRNSANHTYLNDSEQPVTRAVLSDKDVIRCASLWVQCRLPTQSSMPTISSLEAPPRNLSQLSEHLAVVTREAENLRLSLRDANNQSNRAQGEYQSLHDRAVQAEHQCLELRAKQDRLAADLTAVREKAARLEGELQERSTQFSEARREVNRLTAEAQRLTTQNDELQTERNTLIVETNNARNETESLRQVNRERERTIEDLNAAASELERQLRLAREQNSARDAQMDRVLAERDRLREDRQGSQQILTKMEEELRTLRIDNTQLQRIVSGSSENGQLLTRQCSEVAALRIQSENAQKELVELRQQVEMFQDGISGTILGLTETAMTIQKRLTDLTFNLADQDAAQHLSRMVDQLIACTQDAQGAVRGLRRLACFA